MEGHVYIYGQIGSDDTQRGVELQDVVAQVESMKNLRVVNVHIKSGGGYVNVGTAIAEYLKSCPNVVTIAEEFCGSIATIIHTSVPLANRKIVEGTEYFIHNPLVQNISGNADELSELANGLKEPQKKMTEAYVSATGMSYEVIEALMKQETSLTSEQVVSMNFASEIIAKKELKAVALYNKSELNKEKSNLIEKTMSEFKKKFALAVASVCKATGIDLAEVLKEERKSVAMTLVTDKGTLETPYEDLLVGDPAMIDGQPALAGDYTLEDGTVITVDENGMISNITSAESQPAPAEEEEMARLTAQIEALTKELSDVKAMNVSLQEDNAMALETLEKMKAVRSSSKPIVALSNPKVEKNPVVSIKAQAEARKKEYSKK